MKRSPQSLPESSQYNDLPRNILDHLLEGCQIIGPDWRYLYVNEAAANQGRRSKELLVGQTMMEAYPGIENTPLFTVMRQCVEDGTARRIENKFTFPDGSQGWFELRLEPVPAGLFILSLDITERKHTERQERVMYEALQLVNASETLESLMRSILECLKRWSRCEAVGIRIQEGPDFPYYVTSGFPEQFVRMENSLCSYDGNGCLKCDADGTPAVDCMCGNILAGRFDPCKSFFTVDGSFWSNHTTELLATTTEADRQTRTRNRCNSAGYESVALIPLRTGGSTFGLIQLNDKRRNRFTSESIALYRRIADLIAGFVAKKQAEARIAHLNNVLRGIRNVNQLITREKEPEPLIRQACDALVEARGYQSVVIGLTESAGGSVVSHAGAGRKMASLGKMLMHGEVPQCARAAMASRKIVLRRGYEPSCRQCASTTEPIGDQDTLAASLCASDKTYGFIMVCLPPGLGDNSEEQELLQEMAEDLAFAMRAAEIQKDRDRSEADLARVQEQFRQSQKLEAVGRLAGGVAHDFNNILMVQIGVCDFLKKDLGPENPLSADVDQIRESADRAAALTRQLLAFSRKQALRPEVLDLNLVVAGIEKLIRRLIGEDIEIRLSLAEGLGRVMADPGQIEQVIMNLAVNARDAMPRGGGLMVETANVELDHEYAQSHVGAKPGRHVMLAITDTGCGMDEQTQVQLFEPFFTTKGKDKGTGLGLSTVYGIVKQSGGNIWVYSEPEKGSTFKIYLPLVESATTLRPARKIAAAQGHGELILVVEDETTLRKLFSRMIQSFGYKVHAAVDGDEALLLVEQKGLRPDLVITDVVMPGMSGKELADHLSRKLPALKVLYVSGYTDAAIVHHGVLHPRSQFLQKPFNSTMLAGKIHEILKSP